MDTIYWLILVVCSFILGACGGIQLHRKTFENQERRIKTLETRLRGEL